MGEAVEDEEIKLGFRMETAQTQYQPAPRALEGLPYPITPRPKRSIHVAGVTFWGVRKFTLTVSGIDRPAELTRVLKRPLPPAWLRAGGAKTNSPQHADWALVSTKRAAVQ